ncbi:tripartite tricarboxylate transporter TctB family protein [Pelagibacterium montanilacus]|uniref:tripartite tricarboxylate transporter TctB family protein n=1 Tax=Pelagibacterium montanilacus TaxID=2185280 RepID=UPI000F8CE5E1|nr:tripartite tricarboxylate transporter TctB family protein [Pelagibacterium montanilacus]
MFSERAVSIALTAVVGIVLLAMAWGAQDFLRYSRHFPFTFGLIGAVLAAVIIFRDLVVARPPVPDEPVGDAASEGGHSPLQVFAWFALYFGLVPVLGFPLATGVFTVAFLRVVAGAGWILAIVYAAAAMGFIFFMGSMLNMEWPTGFVSRAIMSRMG